MEQIKKKPTALLLGGGGAKGAFQIGAWQALAEAGMTTDITAVAGRSVIVDQPGRFLFKAHT